MKAWIKLIAFSITFLVGVGIGVGAFYLRVHAQASTICKKRWLIERSHYIVLCERADQFHHKFGRWPTNVQELVEAHFLPEYSEVHFCPRQIGAVTRTNYNGFGVG